MKNTIQLQGIGHVQAKPAGDLKVGDVTIWNFGYTALILGKVKETPAYVTLAIREENGDYERRLKKTRLVGFKA